MKIQRGGAHPLQVRNAAGHDAAFAHPHAAAEAEEEVAEAGPEPEPEF